MSLLAQVAGVVFVGLLLASLAAYLSSRDATIDELVAQNQQETLTRMSAMQGAMEHFLRLGHLEGVRDTITDFSSDLDLVNAFVADDQGRIIASTRSAEVGLGLAELGVVVDPDLIERVTRTRTSELFLDKSSGLVDGYISICDPNAYAGLRAPRCGFLFHRASLVLDKARALGYLHKQAGVTIAGCLVFSLLLLFVFHRVISRRVNQILEALTQFSEGDRQARTELRGDDELVTISQRIDDILDRFEQDEADLMQSEKLKQVILDGANAAIIYTDTEGYILFISAGAERMLGYQPQELVGQGAYLLHDPEEVRQRAGTANPEKIRQFIQRSRSEHAYEDEWTYLRKDGTPVSVGLSVTELTDTNGDTTGFLALARDIGTEKKIARSLQLAERVFQSTAEAIVVSDAEYRIVDINPAYSELIGYGREEALGQYPHMEFAADAPRGSMHELRNTVRQKGIWSGELLGRRKTGELFPLSATISLIRDAQGQVSNFVGVCKDVTELKAAEDALQKMAYYDVLTNLPNRSLFKDRLQHAIAVAQRAQSQLALMFIDLDRFKYVNDTLGHDAGDELLKEAAVRLSGTVRKTDSVARLGGDEFTLIVADAKALADIDTVAKKVIDSLEGAFRLAGQEVFIGASIGIAVFPEDGRDVATLVKNADTAMYRAKQAGRGTYRFFTQEMNERNQQRLNLEAKLHRAVESEALELNYQPQIDLTSARVVGIEALLRWRESDYGMITRDIVALAEETGLMLQIGRWVRDTACRQLRQWRDQGLIDLVLSLNLTAREFQEPMLHAEIVGLLEKYQLPVESLLLELTEEAVLADVVATAQVMHRYTDLGVRFVIKKFGLGYLSLARLRDLPIYGIRVDRSLIDAVDQSEQDASIFKALLAMGESMGLVVIADGVESLSQHHVLLQQGCTRAQGFLYARPAPAAGLSQLLSAEDPLIKEIQLGS